MTKYILSENSLNKLTESVNYTDMCSEFRKKQESYFFCTSLREAFKKNKFNLQKLSTEFFRRVLSNSKVFNVAKLDSENPEHKIRLDQLKQLEKILREYNACNKLKTDVKDELTKLEKGGLTMVVDQDGKYGIINKLDTHTSAKAYVLTKIFEQSQDTEFPVAKKTPQQNKLDKYVKIIDNQGNYKIDISKLTDYFTALVYENNIAFEIKNLVKNNPEFDLRLETGLLYSSTRGSEAEKTVKKYLEDRGYEVYDFSYDFGYVDYLGIDGIVIIDGKARPYQVTQSLKPKKILKYDGDDCDILVYYVVEDRIIRLIIEK